MELQRKIIHVDMDAFYASVEQRDNPKLRHFGIHSAMSCARAYRLCPQALFVRPRFEAYRTVSLQIREIFHQYSGGRGPGDGHFYHILNRGNSRQNVFHKGNGTRIARINTDLESKSKSV